MVRLGSLVQLIRSFSLRMQLYLSLSLTSSPSPAYQARQSIVGIFNQWSDSYTM